jgi:hypothetical protein
VRIVLCENGLKDFEGHHFNLAAGLKEELAAREIPLALWANVALDPRALEELAAIPIFDWSPYDARGWTRRGHIRRFLLAAWSFRCALRRGNVHPDDILLLPCARPAEMLGVAMAFRRGKVQPGAVVLNFMLDDFKFVTKSPSLVQFLYWFALACLRLRLALSVLRTRLVLTCASGSLARSISRTCHAEVAIYPMIKSYPAPSARHGERSCTIGVLGALRGDKGEALLPGLLDACARLFPSSRIVVQLPDSLAEPAVNWPPNVEVLAIGLDRKQYFELLNRTDLVVLPYDARTFGAKSSGVFAEAVACGRATVVPAGTWMAEMLQSGRGAGVVFGHFSVESIVDAIEQAVADLDRLRILAGEALGPWRATQSVGAYVDRLLSELGAAA